MWLKSITCLMAVTALFTSFTHGSITGYITPTDRTKLLTVLTTSLIVKEENDITSSYYGAKGFKLLNENLVAVLRKDNCANLQRKFVDSVPMETVYQVLSTWSLLECQGSVVKDTNTLATKATSTISNEKSPISEINYSLQVLKLLNKPLGDSKTIQASLQQKIKDNDSLASLGHALHSAILIGATKFAHDRAEEILVQADEIDNKLLQWEGGLSTTSLLVTGLVKSGAPLTSEQAEKIASYLLTRRTVQTPKGALALVEAVAELVRSSVSPVSITIVGPEFVSVDQPDLRIRISDIMGGALKSPPSPVVAQSATRISDDVVVLSKQPLTPSGSEFILPLRLEPGLYRIVLTAAKHSTTVTVRVLGPVKIEQLEVGLSDSDGGSAPQLQKLQYPSKLASGLQGDSSQRLVVKFTTTRPLHQNFLRLSSSQDREIVFVAELDSKSSNLYKIEVNLASLQYSGVYKLELILGDSVMSSPIRWAFGNIEVRLSKAPEAESVKKGPKPKILHTFRPAEKRPPEVVSLVFTCITVAPFLLLLALWGRLGISFTNVSVWSFAFHGGLAGILGLFVLFWLKLDMFTTCAYLVGVGAFTFLVGQKFLGQIAQANAAKGPQK